MGTFFLVDSFNADDNRKMELQKRIWKIAKTQFIELMRN